MMTAGAVLAAGWWLWRSGATASEAAARLRDRGVDLVRLPDRLRRIAADPRTPRRARWLLVALALYVASPIDLSPDVIPVIGDLDELVIVPLVLVRVRPMLPPGVWAAHFPLPSASSTSQTEIPMSREARIP